MRSPKDKAASAVAASKHAQASAEPAPPQIGGPMGCSIRRSAPMAYAHLLQPIGLPVFGETRPRSARKRVCRLPTTQGRGPIPLTAPAHTAAQAAAGTGGSTAAAVSMASMAAVHGSVAATPAAPTLPSSGATAPCAAAVPRIDMRGGSSPAATTLCWGSIRGVRKLRRRRGQLGVLLARGPLKREAWVVKVQQDCARHAQECARQQRLQRRQRNRQDRGWQQMSEAAVGPWAVADVPAALVLDRAQGWPLGCDEEQEQTACMKSGLDSKTDAVACTVRQWATADSGKGEDARRTVCSRVEPDPCTSPALSASVATAQPDQGCALQMACTANLQEAHVPPGEAASQEAQTPAGTATLPMGLRVDVAFVAVPEPTMPSSRVAAAPAAGEAALGMTADGDECVHTAAAAAAVGTAVATASACGAVPLPAAAAVSTAPAVGAPAASALPVMAATNAPHQQPQGVRDTAPAHCHLDGSNVAMHARTCNHTSKTSSAGQARTQPPDVAAAHTISVRLLVGDDERVVLVIAERQRRAAAPALHAAGAAAPAAGAEPALHAAGAAALAAGAAAPATAVRWAVQADGHVAVTMVAPLAAGQLPLRLPGGTRAPRSFPGGGVALGRSKRVPGNDIMESQDVQRLLRALRNNCDEFEAGGRVLRLKQWIRADVTPPVVDAVLEALAANSRVEALYIQNFEWGMLDAQLDHLMRVLRQGRIWALNVGENFNITRSAWERFAACLPHTAVSYLYVSEHHLGNSNLKACMRDAIRANRKRLPTRDPDVICKIRNMWWNPKMPGWVSNKIKAARDQTARLPQQHKCTLAAHTSGRTACAAHQPAGGPTAAGRGTVERQHSSTRHSGKQRTPQFVHSLTIGRAIKKTSQRGSSRKALSRAPQPLSSHFRTGTPAPQKRPSPERKPKATSIAAATDGSSVQVVRRNAVKRNAERAVCPHKRPRLCEGVKQRNDSALAAAHSGRGFSAPRPTQQPAVASTAVPTGRRPCSEAEEAFAPRATRTQQKQAERVAPTPREQRLQQRQRGSEGLQQQAQLRAPRAPSGPPTRRVLRSDPAPQLLALPVLGSSYDKRKRQQVQQDPPRDLPQHKRVSFPRGQHRLGARTRAAGMAGRPGAPPNAKAAGGAETGQRRETEREREKARKQEREEKKRRKRERDKHRDRKAEAARRAAALARDAATAFGAGLTPGGSSADVLRSDGDMRPRRALAGRAARDDEAQPTARPTAEQPQQERPAKATADATTVAACEAAVRQGFKALAVEWDVSAWEREVKAVEAACAEDAAAASRLPAQGRARAPRRKAGATEDEEDKDRQAGAEKEGARIMARVAAAAAALKAQDARVATDGEEALSLMRDLEDAGGHSGSSSDEGVSDSDSCREDASKKGEDEEELVTGKRQRKMPAWMMEEDVVVGTAAAPSRVPGPGEPGSEQQQLAKGDRAGDQSGPRAARSSGSNREAVHGRSPRRPAPSRLSPSAVPHAVADATPGGSAAVSRPHDRPRVLPDGRLEPTVPRRSVGDDGTPLVRRPKKPKLRQVQEIEGGPLPIVIAPSTNGAASTAKLAQPRRQAQVNKKGGGGNKGGGAGGAHRGAQSNVRPPFLALVSRGLLPTGSVHLEVGNDLQRTITIRADGMIIYRNVEYDSPSAFAVVVLREKNPGRLAADGWREVRYNGQRLSDLRALLNERS